MSDPGTISVLGHGSAVGVPDVCRVSLVATALRPSIVTALADAEQSTRRVREALRAGGVPARDAATSTVSVHAEEDYSGQRGPRLLGYRAEHALDIVLRDLGAAGGLLGDAVAAGGDGVRLQGVSFAVEDDTALREQARAAAWADAVRTAEQLAALAGTALARVRSIDEIGDRGAPPPRPMAIRAAAVGGPEVGLEPGGVSVGAGLAVVWELA